MSYFRCGDPDADFARREHEQEKWLKSRPVCVWCKKHIQDERLMRFDGEFFHIKCAEDAFGYDTDDFI